MLTSSQCKPQIDIIFEVLQNLPRVLRRKHCGLTERKALTPPIHFAKFSRSGTQSYITDTT